jgi:hypothetical protein
MRNSTRFAPLVDDVSFDSQPLTLVTYLYYDSRSAAPTTPATGGEVAEAKMRARNATNAPLGTRRGGRVHDDQARWH